jgi:hypothetical protein
VSNGIEVYTAVTRNWIDVEFQDGDATPDAQMRRLIIEAIKQMPAEQMPANRCQQMPAEQMPANEEQMPANEEPMES